VKYSHAVCVEEPNPNPIYSHYLTHDSTVNSDYYTVQLGGIQTARLFLSSGSSA
jgi:hypothetical protein